MFAFSLVKETPLHISLVFPPHLSRRRLALGLEFQFSPYICMATKMKGIYKGFKYISQIFVVKEREIEIGYPTDVKHVAHIGWDGPSGSAPSWMNESRRQLILLQHLLVTSMKQEAPVLQYPHGPLQDFEYADLQPTTSEKSKDVPATDLPNVPKKPRRKKSKSTSSPMSSTSTKPSMRAAKSKAKYVEGNVRPENLQEV